MVMLITTSRHREMNFGAINKFTGLN